jgi:hypothetical protein
MRHEGGEVTDDRKTAVRDETVDRLFDQTQEAIDDLQQALHDLRAKVLHHA